MQGDGRASEGEGNAEGRASEGIAGTRSIQVLFPMIVDKLVV